jgi:signal transduction histidine kinase
LTSLLEKRQSLHRCADRDARQIEQLKSQVTNLQTLANMGAATYMIAHEINNLLTPLASYASLALNNPHDKDLADKVFRKTTLNCRRASQILESMLALANGEQQHKQQTQLIALVEEIFACLCRDFSKDGITVNLQIPQDCLVWAVPVQIQQVLMNLILNAREAMLGTGGTLTIRAEQEDTELIIEVTDTGCGIDPARLNRIFEPLFTTKADEKTMSQKQPAGLGLAFCKKVVDAHAGSISVASKPNHGSTFTITLPGPPSGVT